MKIKCEMCKGKNKACKGCFYRKYIKQAAKNLSLFIVATFLLSSCQHMGAFAEGFNQGYNGGLNSRASRPSICNTNSYNPGYGHSTTTFTSCY